MAETGPDLARMLHAVSELPTRPHGGGPQPLVADLRGRKQWCSGAEVLDAALLTCRDPQGRRLLAVLDLHAGGITIEPAAWAGVGWRMQAAWMSCSTTYPRCRSARRAPISAAPASGREPRASRRVGTALPSASPVSWPAGGRRQGDAHADGHAGAVDAALAATAALLRVTAAADEDPSGDLHLGALRVRAVAEATAEQVLERTGRALGAAPLCRDAAHARRAADLPVFLRQSHAEHDLAELGRLAGAGSVVL